MVRTLLRSTHKILLYASVKSHLVFIFLSKDTKLQQIVVEFKKLKRFWYPEVDTSKLNDRIFELKNEGWSVLSITPNSNWQGVVKSYSILLQSDT